VTRIEKISARIKPPDRELMRRTQSRLDNLTKPRESLGRLEELAIILVGITGKVNPPIKHKVIFTLAADHGVVVENVSAFPQDVTAQMVYNFLNKGAGINVLADHVGARVVVADLGVACRLKQNPGLKVKKIALGTRNMAVGPAMTRKEAQAAIEAGIDIFEEELKNGIDICGTGEMGIGNTTAAAAITSVLTKKPVGDVTGRGTGIDETGLQNKIRVIQKALKINAPDAKDPIDVLSKVGGFEIGALAGIILAAGAHRVPVVIDGFISGAAALIAYTIEPKIKNILIAGHCSVEKGHKITLAHLGLRPLLDLDLRLGEGTGAALAIGLVEASIKILTRMATFQNAGISEERAR
jgi:nicotinate-nucleotide--dimethylbenzimidazole phosphoribosyltransferase